MRGSLAGNGPRPTHSPTARAQQTAILDIQVECDGDVQLYYVQVNMSDMMSQSKDNIANFDGQFGHPALEKQCQSPDNCELKSSHRVCVTTPEDNLKGQNPGGQQMQPCGFGPTRKFQPYQKA